MYNLKTNYNEMRNNIINQTTLYFRQYPNLKSMVLGVSGGVDSALVAALMNQMGSVKLIGRSLPITTNKRDELDRADAVGNAFCDDYKVHDLGQGWISLAGELEMGDVFGPSAASHSAKVLRGNIKARIRMIQLRHLAGLNDGLVMGTENMTENFMGFFTTGGDSCTDFEPIGGLWKTEVYGLATYLADEYYDKGENDKGDALMGCVAAVPTDGLGITNSDLDQLGVESYEEVDRRMIGILMGGGDPTCPIYKRYNTTHFKRENPYNLPRKTILGMEP